MSKKMTLLAATVLVTVSTLSFADDTSQTNAKVQYKDNGGYESTQSTQQTNPDGTTVQKDITENVDVDSNGNVKKTVEKTSKTSAGGLKGILHHKSRDEKSTFVEKDRGGYTETTTRKFTNTDGTNTYYKTVTDVSVDKDGNVTTTANTEKTVDPKGLFNKKTTTQEKTKSVNGTVVEDKQSSD